MASREAETSASRARYIMVGGFLGAGKTTALLKLAERFRNQGLRVGLITNDQSVGLVDTAMLENHRFPVEETADGCLRIAACYPRAVKWLFHAVGVKLPDTAEVLNMRTDTADAVVTKLLEPPANA